MKSAMKFALMLNIIAGLILFAVYFLFTTPIVSIFMKDNPQVINASTMILRALMTASPVLGILFVFNFTFQAMGKALPSLTLAISRQGFIFLPMVFILNSIFGLKGLIYAQPIADYVSVTMALIMFLVMNRKLHKAE